MIADNLMIFGSWCGGVLLGLIIIIIIIYSWKPVMKFLSKLGRR